MWEHLCMKTNLENKSLAKDNKRSAFIACIYIMLLIIGAIISVI